MDLICTTLSESSRAVRLLQIQRRPSNLISLAAPVAGMNNNNWYVASRWEAHGYEWEIRFYPCRDRGCGDDGFYMALELVFLSELCANQQVTASLSGRLVHPTGVIKPSAEKTSPSRSFQRPTDSSEKVVIMSRREAHAAGYLQDHGSVTVECTITVPFEGQPKDDKPLPHSDLHKDLGQLFQSGTGADVEFVVSGESFAAHKSILAARSPVFMAEFFGEMKEKISRRVEIKETEPAVFKAMLGFIYTGRVPPSDELDENHETGTTLFQHLLVAADLYGLEGLKVICERRIGLGIDAATVATTLALAEQHGCLELKAKCVEFITGGSDENLDAVLATEGFKSLEATTPSVVTDLLKASHKRARRDRR